MTVDEFDDALSRLIDRYLEDPSNGTSEDIAWILENTAKQIREGAFEQG